jgi:hypothetical protein
VDFTAAETPRTLHGLLAGQGISLVFSEVIEGVQVEFDRSKLTELFGMDAISHSSAAVVSAYGQREAGGNTGM